MFIDHSLKKWFSHATSYGMEMKKSKHSTSRWSHKPHGLFKSLKILAQLIDKTSDVPKLKKIDKNQIYYKNIKLRLLHSWLKVTEGYSIYIFPLY